MKANVTVNPQSPNTPYLTFDEIKNVEGIYEPIFRPNTHVVIWKPNDISNIKRGMITGNDIYKLQELSWINDKFIKSSDSLTVTFSNE